MGLPWIQVYLRRDIPVGTSLPRGSYVSGILDLKESKRTNFDGIPNGNGGGGSGYFGGGNSNNAADYGGGGGSSFISGHTGCIAIAEDFTEENMKFSPNEDQSIHFSGIRFSHTVMIDGNSPCPSPKFVHPSYQYDTKGHPNNGFICKTKLSSLFCACCINMTKYSEFVHLRIYFT